MTSKKKRTVLIGGAGALATATAVVSAIALSNSSVVPAQAEKTSEAHDRQLNDVATVDPFTGEKVQVDTESQVVKQLGEAGMLTVEGNTDSTFEITVHSVSVHSDCTLRGFGDTLTPENGKFLLLDVSATLAAEADSMVAEEQAIMPLDSSAFGVAAGQNQEISFGLDTTAAFSCEVERPLDIAVGAGSTIHGQVMLDSPYSSGQVIYDPERSGGWTWAY